MMPSLGLTSYAYYWAARATGRERINAHDLLDRVSGFGLAALQICENVSFSGWRRSDLERFGVQASERGIELEVGTRGLVVGDLQRALRAAAACSASTLRLVPWSKSPGRGSGVVEELQQVIAAVLPECKARGITLAIENYFEVSDDELVGVVSEIGDDSVGICLDTANSVGLLRDPVDTAHLLAPWAVSMHLKDYRVVKPDIGYEIIGAPLGEGLLDVMGVLETVWAADSNPNILLELWVPPGETEAATLAREEAWLETSVKYIRQALDSADQTNGVEAATGPPQAESEE